MKIEFKTDNEKDIGYTLIAETEEEEYALLRIRHLSWYGRIARHLLDKPENDFVYAGRSSGHKKLHWLQQKYLDKVEI
ncbi:hypothetical protein CMI37_36970 [Candidatus Pacearchaeota archaeon]|nr:hypothetical protein [Candidatus Pacearchaeota archaeon]|tara:strand:+ start:1496 stop:1729 length:234 start_codon:yes stop_codon:yes gene_type:complete